MKIEKGTLVKDFPLRLRQLVLDRAKRINPSQSDEFVLERTVTHAFSWNRSPEGDQFWRKIYNGNEFEWEEDMSYELY